MDFGGDFVGHYVYKYVAGGSGGVLSGNNIRPFKYMSGKWFVSYWWGGGKVNKKKRIVHTCVGYYTLF